MGGKEMKKYKYHKYQLKLFKKNNFLGTVDSNYKLSTVKKIWSNGDDAQVLNEICAKHNIPASRVVLL